MTHIKTNSNMRNRKKEFCVAVLMSIGLIGLQAQSIFNIKEYTGSNTSLNTNTIRRLTFSGGDMNVLKFDGSSHTYPVSTIRRLDFYGISTTIELVDQNLQNEQKTQLYPNPASDQLYIKSSFAENCELKIEIMNLQGKILLKATIQPLQSINISNLKKGMYICRLYACDKIENKKFIKR